MNKTNMMVEMISPSPIMEEEVSDTLRNPTFVVSTSTLGSSFTVDFDLHILYLVQLPIIIEAH